MKISCMIDDTRYLTKPQKMSIACIQKNIHKKSMEISELASALVHGQSFRPSVLNGRTKDTWVQQQLFGLDFDHDVTVDEVLACLQEHHLTPVFTYYTFTHTSENPRFRVILCSDTVIKDALLRDQIQATLMGIVKKSDKKCKNRDRLFLGTNKRNLAQQDFEARFNGLALIHAYWKAEYEAYLTIQPNISTKQSNQKKESIKKPKIKTATDIYSYQPQKAEKKMAFWQGEVAQYLIRCLDNCFQSRIWVEGSKRSNFLFIYYNTLKMIMSPEEAYQRTIEKNQAMTEPLEDYYFLANCIHADAEGFYTYSPQRIIDSLELSMQDALSYGFFEAARKREQGKTNNDLAKQRDLYIATRYLKYGDSCSKIAKELPENMKIQCKSRQSVHAILKKLDIVDKKGRADLLESVPWQNRYCHNISDKKCQNFAYTTDESFSKKEDFDKMNDFFIEKQDSSMSDYQIPTKRMFSSINERELTLNLLRYSKRNLSIQGEAGTGKTSLVKEYYQSLNSEEKQKVKFLAITNMNAISLPYGETIHSYFSIPLTVLNENMIPFNLYQLQKIDTIIIDEIGRVRADIFQCICNGIEYMKQHYNHSIRLIIVGDYTQIPPIVTKSEEFLFYQQYHQSYAFGCKQYEKQQFLTIHLYQVLRQKDKVFQDCLKGIKYLSKKAFHLLWNLSDHKVKEGAISIVPTNALANKINLEEVERYHDTQTITSVLHGKMQQIKIAIGMRMMITRTTSTYANGMIGKVTKIAKNEIQLNVNGMIKKVKAKKGMFALQYAFAITADKAQGLTLSEDVNIYNGFFAPGQLYVALSRCEKLSQIHMIGDFSKEPLIGNEMALRYSA